MGTVGVDTEAGIVEADKVVVEDRVGTDVVVEQQVVRLKA